MTFKTVRRDWLKRQVESGKVSAKCNYKYTDDYAFDNAVGFQKTEWMPARVRHPKFADEITTCGNRIGVCTDPDFKDGYINFMDCDFTFKSGSCYWLEDGTIRFSPLSNSSYTLRITA